MGRGPAARQQQLRFRSQQANKVSSVMTRQLLSFLPLGFPKYLTNKN